MISGVYALKDVKVGFWKPFTQPNDAVAKREFDNLVNGSADTFIVQNYQDLELYKIGSYDDETGVLTSDVQYLLKGVDVKKVGE